MDFTLNNGVNIPAVGFGTWRLADDAAYKGVVHALRSSYTHIDSASIYQNEDLVGKAIAESGVGRDKIFLTTKVWNNVSSYAEAKAAVEESLAKLGTDYVDLFLVHWPGSYERNAAVYRALEDALKEGKTRAIGVSNFLIHHLDALMKVSTVVPAVNQIECHVALQGHRTNRYCQEKSIFLQAYAPLMSDNVSKIINNEILSNIGKKYGKTAAQVALRWLVERKIVALPKSQTPARIDQNIAIFDFSLDQEDMKEIRQIHEGKKLFPDPDNMDMGFPLETC